MNKVTITMLVTAFVFSGSNTVFADEESIRGEAAEAGDALPRDNQEDLPYGESHSDKIIPLPRENSNKGKPSPKSKAPDSKNQESLSSTFSTQDDGFIEGSHLHINLRNQYVNHRYKHPRASGVPAPAGWRQWAQGISVDYVSGYALGMLGLDTSLYSGIKLDGRHPRNAPDQLLHTEKNNSRYSRIYSRIGRLNAKFLLGNAQNNAVIRYGIIGVDTALLADSSSRLLESSYRGGSVDASLEEFDNLRLYGFYVDRIGLRAGNSYNRFSSSIPGKHIDNIQVYGAGYTLNDLGGDGDYLYLNGEYGVSKNYTRRYFGQVSYNFAFSDTYSLLANLQYLQGEKAGKLWVGGLDGFDKQANHINANLMGTLNSLKVAVSYSYTNAKNNKSGAKGADSYQFNTQLAANDYGSSAYWTSRQVSNFNYDKENAYQAMVDYDFTEAGVAGLSVSLTQTYGSGMNKATGLKNEEETDLMINYDFPQPALKGLSLKMEQAWYVSKNLKNTAMVSGKRLIDTRIYANYNLAVF